MTYEINKTNGVKITDLVDNTTETIGGITLVGKSTRNYGESLNENLLKLTENFSNSSPPSSTLLGQLWWNTTDNKLMVKYNAADLATSWKPVNTPTVSGTAPSAPANGDLWWDTSLSKLKLWNGTSWVVIGPPDTSVSSTGVFSEVNSGNTVLNVKIAGSTVALISGSTFTASPAYANFPAEITPGITLRQSSQLGQLNLGSMLLTTTGVIPKTDNTINLGSASYKFNTIYGTNFTGNAATATTAGSATSAGSAAQWASSRTVTFATGDVTGSFSIDGSANVNNVALSLTKTIGLGTDTSGNYISNLTGGNGIEITGSPTEDWNAGVGISTIGQIRIGSLGVNVVAPAAGQISAAGEITAFASDQRLKTNIESINNALAKVNSLNGVTYNFNQLASNFDFDVRKRHVGLLAQEVDEVLPEAVRPAPFDLDENGQSKSGEKYLTVQYEKLVPLLVESIKELTARVAQLEQELAKKNI